MFVCLEKPCLWWGFLLSTPLINIEKLKINVKIFLQFNSFVLYLYQQTN